MAETITTETFDILDGHQYMNLTTFRANGDGKATPVWFAREGDSLYVTTGAESYKVRRLRRNTDAVTVQPCDVQGNPLDGGPKAAGRAVIHEDGTPEAKRANRALNRKYHVIKFAFDVMGHLRGGDRVYLEITPANQ